jgi:hypothetical protein
MPNKAWKRRGEFFEMANPTGSHEPRWPWLIRGVHDWVSPNGVEFHDANGLLMDYPDNQAHFMDGAL